MSAIIAEVSVLPILVFSDPAIDFSDGLEVLRAYHDHFLVQGQRLLALAQAIHQQGLDEQRSAEATQFADYYEQATQLHHRDEEHALFPLIINKSFLIDGMIERLALDHEEIEQLWDELCPLLRACDTVASRQIPELAARFEKNLRTHLERENLDFFPLIADPLSPGQYRALGESMYQLRQA
jgi:hemerythrin-like domain-containing protein